MKVPNHICETRSCTGCMACYNICHKNAIMMIPDDEGFLRPSINNNKCVGCNQCIKVCPVNNQPHKVYPIKKYSGFSRNENNRLRSASGGVFFEIAIQIIKMNGIVFGCILDDNLKAIHTYTTTEEGLRKMQGSKYVQSFIGNSFCQVKTFLKENKIVLFSGTPCQIAGLKNYLGKNYQNLYTIDLVCHGVPSPMIFEDYKKYLFKSEKFSIIDNISFRGKQDSWLYFNMLVTGYDSYGNKKIYKGGYWKDPYLRGFLREYFLRPCCHQCQYTSIDRISDFTIADWWTYKKIDKEDKNFQKKGVSLLFVNTNKSFAILKSVNLKLNERTTEDAIKTSLPLSKSFPPSKERIMFWKDYKRTMFDDMIKKYMQPEKLPWDMAIYTRYPTHPIIKHIFFNLKRIVDIPLKIKNKINGN